MLLSILILHGINLEIFPSSLLPALRMALKFEFPFIICDAGLNGTFYSSSLTFIGDEFGLLL